MHLFKFNFYMSSTTQCHNLLKITEANNCSLKRCKSEYFKLSVVEKKIFLEYKTSYQVACDHTNSAICSKLNFKVEGVQFISIIKINYSHSQK